MASGDLNRDDAEESQVQSDVLRLVLLRRGPTAKAEVEREMAHEVNGPLGLDAVRCATTVAAVHMSTLSV